MSRRRNTVAITFRVMSSWVGPNPPVTITTSARWMAVRNASPRCSGSSPTVAWYEGQSPTSERSPPTRSRFVFWTSPWRSSLPTVMTSTVMSAMARSLRTAARSCARPHAREDLQHEIGIKAREHVVGHDTPPSRKLLRAPDRRGLPDVEDAKQHEAHDQGQDMRRNRDPDRGHAADRDHHARHLIDDDRMGVVPQGLLCRSRDPDRDRGHHQGQQGEAGKLEAGEDEDQGQGGGRGGPRGRGDGKVAQAKSRREQDGSAPHVLPYPSVFRTSLQATLSVSNTPVPRSATASKYGALRGFSSRSRSSMGTTRGRSRLLYCMTKGIFSIARSCSVRLSSMFM